MMLAKDHARVWHETDAYLSNLRSELPTGSLLEIQYTALSAFAWQMAWNYERLAKEQEEQDGH